jgi:hypothetical protein
MLSPVQGGVNGIEDIGFGDYLFGEDVLIFP